MHSTPLCLPVTTKQPRLALTMTLTLALTLTLGCEAFEHIFDHEEEEWMFEDAIKAQVLLGLGVGLGSGFGGFEADSSHV